MSFGTISQSASTPDHHAKLAGFGIQRLSGLINCPEPIGARLRHRAQNQSLRLRFTFRREGYVA